MKNLVFALLLAVSPCFAATDNPDGSVTLTHEEAQALVDRFQEMSADAEQYQIDREKALQVLKKMQDYINALEKGKCT